MDNVQISSDIFYQVKKQILDKLDIILQKINLQIARNKKKPDFTYIELATFQGEISSLFSYLDRLYESLSSSISEAGSVSSVKYHTKQNLNDQNERLLTENENLKRQLESVSMKLGERVRTESRNGLKGNCLKKYLKIVNQCKQIQRQNKEIKNQLKGYKFSLLEDRVQIISKMKQFETAYEGNQEEEQAYHDERNMQILNEINTILDIC